MPRLVLVLLALSLGGCLTYEYEHEFWLNVDGSGRVYVTGQPWLWQAFKSVGTAADPEGTATPEAVRALFEKSGLRVRRTTLTRRRGRPYVFISADFDDVSRLSTTPAFPDLDIRLVRDGERLRLQGTWRSKGAPVAGREADGLMAVRFHLPSKVYAHDNASDGVERGNIVGWRQEVAAALRGEALAFGATMDRRSILWSTVGLFGSAIVLALATLGVVLYVVVRKGRSATSSSSPASRS
jgi:hypothetical protein